MKETLTLRVRYMGIAEGTPPHLAFIKLLTQSGGKHKIHSQYIPISDAALLTRLKTEFETGQEVEIVVETDWSQPGIPQTLCDIHAPDVSTPVAAQRAAGATH